MPAFKRPAAAPSKAMLAAAKKAKRAKKEPVDPATQRCLEVASAIRQADSPAAVLDMVEAMLGEALMSYKEERHEFQENVLDMASQLLASAEHLKAANVEAAKASMATGEEIKSASDAAAASAKVTLESSAEETSAKKRALAEHAKAFQAAKQAAEQAQLQEVMHQQDLRQAATKRDHLLAAERDQLKPLIEGVEGEEKAKELVGALTGVLTAFSFDASILAALPNAFLKASSARGPFDVMVLEQVGKDLTQRVAVLDSSLSKAEEAKAADAAAVREATEKLQVLSAAQQAGADAFTAAQVAEKEAKTALQDVQQTLKDVGPELRKLAKELSSAEYYLASFRRGPMASFALMRERVAPPPAPEPVEAEVQAEAEAAEEQVEDAVMEPAEAAEALADGKMASMEEAPVTEASVLAAGA